MWHQVTLNVTVNINCKLRRRSKSGVFYQNASIAGLAMRTVSFPIAPGDSETRALSSIHLNLQVDEKGVAAELMVAGSQRKRIGRDLTNLYLIGDGLVDLAEALLPNCNGSQVSACAENAASAVLDAWSQEISSRYSFAVGKTIDIDLAKGLRPMDAGAIVRALSYDNASIIRALLSGLGRLETRNVMVFLDGESISIGTLMGLEEVAEGSSGDLFSNLFDSEEDTEITIVEDKEGGEDE